MRRNKLLLFLVSLVLILSIISSIAVVSASSSAEKCSTLMCYIQDFFSPHEGCSSLICYVQNFFSEIITGQTILNSSEQAACPSGMVSYWNFDDALGSTAFDAFGINDGTILGGASWTTGQVLEALNFDGVDDYVSVPDRDSYPLGTNSFTISFWWKPATLSGGQQFIGQKDGDWPYNNWLIYYQGAGPSLILGLSDGSNWHPQTFSCPMINTPDVWYFITAVRDGNDFGIYVNGISLGTTTDVVSQKNINSDLQIGNSGYGADYLSGTLDEVAIYNRALGADEINTNYQNGLQGKGYCEALAQPVCGNNIIETGEQCDDGNAADGDGCSSTCQIEIISECPSGMVSYWKFDDALGATAFDAFGINNGTLVNDPVWTAGQVGGALSFDGVDDYVKVLDSPSLNSLSQFTMEGWFYINDISDYRRILFRPGQYAYHIAFLFNPSGTVRFGSEASDGSYSELNSATAVTAGNWVHVAIIHDGSTKKIYINGIQDANTESQSGFNNNVISDISLGMEEGNQAQQFYGKMDEIAIYDRALSASEIQQQYQNGLAGKGYCEAYTGPICGNNVIETGETCDDGNTADGDGCSSACQTEEAQTCPAGTVSYWNLDDAGTTAADVFGINDGTLVNGPVWTAGQVGGALQFDGIDDYVSIPDSNSLDLVNNFAISLWFKPALLGQTATYLLGKLNDAGNDNTYSIIWEYAGDSVEFYSGSYTGSNPRAGTSIAISDTNWHNVIYTYNGSLWQGYLDGNQEFSTEATFSLIPSNNNLLFGLFDSGAPVFNGLMDEVAIYNRALSAAEINAAYQTGLQGKGYCEIPAQPVCGNNVIESGEQCDDGNTADGDGCSSTCQTESLSGCPSGMISYWNFDSAGTAIDSVGSNPGTLVNDPIWTTGKVGGALSFDGVDDYVEVADDPSLIITDTLSIEFWAKRQNFGFDLVLEKGGDWTGGQTDYGVGLLSLNNNMFYFIYNGGFRGTSGVSDYDWHHYVVVAKNGDVNPTLYIDGVAKAVDFSGGLDIISMYPSDLPLHIGAQVDTVASYYGNNVLDEVAIYNRALSAYEVNQDYQKGMNGYSYCGDISFPAVCGNNVIEAGEQCDDGNIDDGDGCSSACQTEQQQPACGNGIIEAGEQCDDGANNGQPLDSCSSDCQQQQPVCDQPITLTSDMTLTRDYQFCGSGFTINADNIVLDCAGHNINYSYMSYGAGVLTSGFNGITIKNCNILQGDSSIGTWPGIKIESSSNDIISDNNILTSSSYVYGIQVTSGSNNVVISNNIVTTTGPGSNGISISYGSDNGIISNNIVAINSDYSYGIESSQASGGTFENNTVTTIGSSAYGIYIVFGSNNKISDNTVVANGNGIFIESDNNVLSNNNVTVYNYGNGIMIWWLSNATVSDNIVTTTGGCLNIHQVTGSTFENNTVTCSSYTSGFQFDTTTGSTFNSNIITAGSGISGYSSGSDNNIADNEIVATTGSGIRLDSDNNIISGNDITASSTGISYGWGSNATITDNNIAATGDRSWGIQISSTSNDIISNNTVTTNGYDSSCIILGQVTGSTFENNNVNPTGSSSDGFQFGDTSGNTFSNNVVTVGVDGSVGIHGYGSSDNNITDNIIVVNGNNAGIRLDSNNNIISGNDITASNDQGIAYGGGANVIIQDNDINGGIQIGSSDSVISDNNINSNWVGIQLGTVEDNTVSNNVIASNNGPGIASWSGDSNDNLLANNSIISTNAAGINFASGANNIFTDNNIVSWDSGINVGGGDGDNRNNVIENNILNSSSSNCIHIEGEFNIINNNSITTDNAHGIYSWGGNNEVITNNIIYTSNAQGIHFDNGNSNDIANNDISMSCENNGCPGIDFGSGASNTITSNTISVNATNSWAPGIHFGGEESTDNTVANNTITSSTTGIQFDNGHDNALENNSISTSCGDNSGCQGINLNNGNNNALSDNIITASCAGENTGCSGINLNSGENNVLANNTITASCAGENIGCQGISSWNGNNQIISNNNISTSFEGTNGGASGIEIGSESGSSLNIITSNIISTNAPSNAWAPGIHLNGQGAGDNNNDLIANNIISSSNGPGIQSDSVSIDNSIIENNTIISSNQPGIGLWNGASDNSIANNNIITSCENSGCPGIALDYGSSNNILSNTISANATNGWGPGIFFNSGDSNTLANNNIASSSGSPGINFENGNNNNLANNIITSSESPCIHFEGGYYTISNNILIVTNGVGIASWNGISSDNTLTNNNINADNSYGIAFWSGGDNNLFAYNTVNSSNGQGIGIQDGSNNNISSNIINTQYDGYSAVRFWGVGQNNNIENNIINSIDAFGIHFDTGNNNIISINVIASSNWPGIDFESGNNNNFSNNRISTSGEGNCAGMYFGSSCSLNTVTSNIITTDSSGWAPGIYAGSTTGNSILDNIIQTLGSGLNPGINVESATDTVITGNTIYIPSDETVGIYTDSDTNTVVDNHIIVGGSGPVCGNGVIEAGEQCDDGNAADGDGCSSACQIEDTTPPVTTDNYLYNGQWTNLPSAIVSLTALDDSSGIKQTNYCINDNCGIYFAPLTLNSDNIYNLTYYSTDNANNVESQKQTTIKLDATSPLINIAISPKSWTSCASGGWFFWLAFSIDGGNVAYSTVHGCTEVSADIDASISGLNNYKIRLYDQNDALVAESTDSAIDFNFETSMSSYRIVVEALDNANNYATQSMTVYEDDDQDYVPDILDLCPTIKPVVDVNKDGCPDQTGVSSKAWNNCLNIYTGSASTSLYPVTALNTFTGQTILNGGVTWYNFNSAISNIQAVSYVNLKVEASSVTQCSIDLKSVDSTTEKGKKKYNAVDKDIKIQEENKTGNLQEAWKLNLDDGSKIMVNQNYNGNNAKSDIHVTYENKDKEKACTDICANTKKTCLTGCNTLPKAQQKACTENCNAADKTCKDNCVSAYNLNIQQKYDGMKTVSLYDILKLIGYA